MTNFKISSLLRYIDDVIFILNPNFCDWIPLIYPLYRIINKLNNSDDLARLISRLIYKMYVGFDIHVSSQCHNPWPKRRLYQLFAYGVYFSKLIRYACNCYSDITKLHQYGSRKLINRDDKERFIFLSQYRSFQCSFDSLSLRVTLICLPNKCIWFEHDKQQLPILIYWYLKV